MCIGEEAERKNDVTAHPGHILSMPSFHFPKTWGPSAEFIREKYTEFGAAGQGRDSGSIHSSEVANPSYKGMRPKVKAKCGQSVCASQHGS